MGRKLYHETGLKHYIERLYGLPDSQIGLEFAMQRLRHIEGFLGAHMRACLHRSRTVDSFGPTDWLVRPCGGFGTMYQIVRRCLESLGVRVRLNEDVRAIVHRNGGYEVRSQHGPEYFDAIVSTLPAGVLLRMCGEPCRARFEHIGLISLFYRAQMQSDATVLFNFTHRGLWKRISVFSRYYGRSRGLDYLTVEVTTSDVSENARLRTVEDFEEHADELGIFAGAPSLAGFAITEHAYPLFRVGSDSAAAAFDRLRQIGIYTVGRQGNHQYLSSVETVRQACQLARVVPIARNAAG
jgi:protoporphyrinogen oxidase